MALLLFVPCKIGLMPDILSATLELQGHMWELMM